MIKNLKRVLYLKESKFGSDGIYDKTAAFREIKIADLTSSKNEEKLEITYENKERELGATTSTGRTKGKFSFMKNVDASLVSMHSEIVGAALGSLEGTKSTATITAVTVTDTAELTIGVDWTARVGQIVRVAFADGTEDAYNVIESATAVSITLKFPMGTVSAGKLAASDEVTSYKHNVLGKPDNSESFMFVIEYDEHAPEVFSGCGITAKMEFTTEGQGKINFDVEAAIVANKDSAGNFYEDVTGSITLEGEHKPVFYDFCMNYVSDMQAVPAPTEAIPQTFALSIANTLIPFTHQGGCTNNIGQWYTKGVVTAEAHYDRTPTILELFKKDNENLGTQYVFLAQEQIALYTAANFTNEDTGSVNDFDSAKYNVDVNFSTTVECLLVLPQEA